MSSAGEYAGNLEWPAAKSVVKAGLWTPIAGVVVAVVETQIAFSFLAMQAFPLY